jgi:hypothetical protein
MDDAKAAPIRMQDKTRTSAVKRPVSDGWKIAISVLVYLAAETVLNISSDFLDLDGSTQCRILYLLLFIVSLVFQTLALRILAKFMAENIFPYHDGDSILRQIVRLITVIAACVFLYYLCAGYSIFLANRIRHLLYSDYGGFLKTWSFAWQHAENRMEISEFWPSYVIFFPTDGRILTTANLLFSGLCWWEYISLIAIPMLMC